MAPIVYGRNVRGRTRLVARVLRWIPSGTRGKMLLARALLRPLPKGSARVRTREGVDLEVPSLREPVAFHLLVDGTYEPALGRLMRRTLRPGDTFLDVGANVGVFTVLGAQLVGPTGRVVAVEASARLAAILRRNVSGLGNVTVVEGAAAEEPDVTLEFYEAPEEHFGMGALAPQFGSRPTAVRSTTLDWIAGTTGLGSVRLMKADVEGFERRVFEGARSLLGGASAPMVVFEFCPWAEERAGYAPGAAQAWLLSLGFRLWTIRSFLAGEGALLRPAGVDDTIVAVRP